MRRQRRGIFVTLFCAFLDVTRGWLCRLFNAGIRRRSWPLRRRRSWRCPKARWLACSRVALRGSGIELPGECCRRLLHGWRDQPVTGGRSEVGCFRLPQHIQASRSRHCSMPCKGDLALFLPGRLRRRCTLLAVRRLILKSVVCHAAVRLLRGTARLDRIGAQSINDTGPSMGSSPRTSRIGRVRSLSVMDA